MAETRFRYRWWQFWRPKCEHWWCPAAIHRMPAKICDDCGAWTEITCAEFYAEFGKPFEVLIRSLCR